MVGKNAKDKAYKSKVKVDKKSPRQYSLRQRPRSISYNETLLSCMNAGLADEIEFQEYDQSNHTNTSDTRGTTLKNGAQESLKNSLNDDQTLQSQSMILRNQIERKRAHQSDTLLCNKIKVTSHNNMSNYIDGDFNEGEMKSSTERSERGHPLSESESDTTSDTVSDCDDNGMLFKRTKLTHLKSGHVNRLLSICEVCGAGFCRKGDLVAHMNLVHHQAVQNYTDLWNQRYRKNDDSDFPSMPKLERELDFIPNVSKPLPCFPKQKNEAPQIPDENFNTPQSPIQKCEAPLCQVPSMPLQKCEAPLSQVLSTPLRKCETFQDGFPDVSQLQCEDNAKQAQDMPLLKCEVTTNQTLEIKISQNYDTVESTLLQSNCEVSELKCDNLKKVEPYQSPQKCMASDIHVFNKNKTKTCAILSESNIHKWNIYNNDVISTNIHQESSILSSSSDHRNGNILSILDPTGLTTSPFSLQGPSRKLSQSHKENVDGLDKNGNADFNTSISAEKIVSNVTGSQCSTKTFNMGKLHNKENFCRHGNNLKVLMNKSMTGSASSSTSYMVKTTMSYETSTSVSNSVSYETSTSVSNSMSYETSSSLIRSSESNKSSLNTLASKYDDYMVLPGRQNVKLVHRLQKCQKCGKGFSRLSDLTAHSLTHDPKSQRSTSFQNLIPSSSPACHMEYESKCGRGRPRKIDSEKTRKDGCKDFLKQSSQQTSNNKVCPICKKKFQKNSSLQAHFRVHSGEKPFKCRECGKSFTQKGNLKIHSWIHTQERPYQCSVCSFRYNQLNLLLYHQLKVHNMRTGKKSKERNRLKT